jgi:hypothetical protein
VTESTRLADVITALSASEGARMLMARSTATAGHVQIGATTFAVSNWVNQPAGAGAKVLLLLQEGIVTALGLGTVVSGVTDHGALTGLADDDHPQYVKDTGDTMTGNLAINKSSAQVHLQGAGNPGVYWVDQNKFVYVTGGILTSADGGGSPQPFRVGSPGTDGASAVNRDYLWNYTGVNGFALGKVGSGTVIHTFQLGAVPYAATVAVHYSIMGGYASAANSVISVGLGTTSGISGLQNFFPSQGHDAASAKWVTCGGGFKGSVAANTACSVQILGYTNQGEGAYWTGMFSWMRS